MASGEASRVGWGRGDGLPATGPAGNAQGPRSPRLTQRVADAYHEPEATSAPVKGDVEAGTREPHAARTAQLERGAAGHQELVTGRDLGTSSARPVGLEDLRGSPA